MDETKKVLIVDDEVELAEVLKDYLEIEGFNVTLASDGKEGFAEFLSADPNIVLLDIMLPKLDGTTLCKKIRENSNVPVIMLSARNGEMDKVVALGSGADDYVTKPFSPLELVARVKAQLRRFNELNDSNSPKGRCLKTNEITVGKLKLNKDTYCAYIGEEKVDFTTKEFDILYFLMNNENNVFSKDQIYENIWGMKSYGDITSVTVYIRRIREKLLKYNLDYIKTIWGVGYKLSV